MYSNQELFDIAYKGIVKQGKPGRTNSGTRLYPSWNCRYQTFDGLHCAVGKIVKHANVLVERTPRHPVWNCVGNVVMLTRALKEHDIDVPWNKEQIDLLLDIQNVHDRLSNSHNFIDAFKESMAFVANIWNLEVPDDA